MVSTLKGQSEQKKLSQQKTVYFYAFLVFIISTVFFD